MPHITLISWRKKKKMTNTTNNREKFQAGIIYINTNIMTRHKITRMLFLSMLLVIIFSVSSCVRDEGDPCPNYLKIVYDYNIEYVDQFHRQVTFLSIFMFDAETGILVREVKQEKNPFPENYTIEVPEDWLGRNYDIVVWAGLDPDSYDYPTLTPGTSTLSDFELKVKGYTNQIVNRNSELEPLWHGKLENVTFTDNEEKTYAVSLMKDTKKFRMVVQSLDESTLITSADVDIQILSSGGWYDNENNVLDPKDREILYRPYYTADDPETGAVAEMNTLRLMNDNRSHRLIITDKVSGNTILNISLLKYLQTLRLLEYSNVPFQEYLDREDEYYMLIFLQKGSGGGGNWLAVEIVINDWTIRIQDIET